MKKPMPAPLHTKHRFARSLSLGIKYIYDTRLMEDGILLYRLCYQNGDHIGNSAISIHPSTLVSMYSNDTAS